MPKYNANNPVERQDYVEPGDYTVEVVNAKERTSKNGHEMIELQLRTSEGSTLFDYLVFTKKSYWKIDVFRAATGDKVKTEQGVDVCADDLIGRKGKAELDVEEYEGRKRNKVPAWICKSEANDEVPF